MVDRSHFTWAGGTVPGQGHYYRVQGGTFVLEYDNTQNGANHAHTVWRDFDRDFGADLLKQHYLESHGPPGSKLDKRERDDRTALAGGSCRRLRHDQRGKGGGL